MLNCVSNLFSVCASNSMLSIVISLVFVSRKRNCFLLSFLFLLLELLVFFQTWRLYRVAITDYYIVKGLISLFCTVVDHYSTAFQATFDVFQPLNLHKLIVQRPLCCFLALKLFLILLHPNLIIIDIHIF